LSEAKLESQKREDTLKSELAAAKEAAEHERMEASEEADSNQARISDLEKQLAAQSALWAQAEDDARYRIGDLEMKLVASTPASPVHASSSIGSRDSPKNRQKAMSLQLEAAVFSERIRELEQDKTTRVEELERALQAKEQELVAAKVALAPPPPLEDAEAQQALSRLELELEATKVRFAALETEKEGLLLQAQELKDELRRSELERASLQISVERLVEEKAAASAERAIAAVELERTLSQQREEQATRIEELEEALQAKDSEPALARSAPSNETTTATAAELADLRSRLAALESEKDQALRKAEEQRTEFQRLEAENANLQMRVERMVEEKTTAAADRAIAAAEQQRGLARQREEQEVRIEELLEELVAKDQELEQTRASLASRPQKDPAAQQAVNKLEHDLAAMRSRVEALESEKQGLIRQVDDQQKSLQQTEEREASLQASIQRLADEKSLAVSELEQALGQQQEAQTNNDAVSKLQEEQKLLMDHFQSELQSTTAAIEHMRAQKLEVEAALALAREEASAKSSEVEELLNQNNQLSQASEQMLEENRQVVADLDRHKRDLASLRTELSVIKAQATSKSQSEIDALEAEVAKAKELEETLRLQTAECSKLREAHATLEAEHGRLAMRARMDNERSQEVDALKAQLSSLMRERDEANSERQRQLQELERNNQKLAHLELFRDSAEAEIEEMKRLSEQHASERGTLDAEAARLRAENDVLAAESRDMLLRLTELETRLSSMHGFERTSEAVASNGGCLGEAERWVLNEAALPLETETMLYFGRVSIRIHDLAEGPASELASENAAHRKRLKTTLESGDAARMSLQVYRIHDPDRQGCLYWPGGQLLEYVEAAFVQHKLSPPKEAAVRWLFDRFAEDGIGSQKLDAKCCLGLVDALLRGAFYFEGTVEADAPSVADVQKESDPFEAVQVKLRSRLDQAEQAADRALARAKTIASSAHQSFGDVRLTPTSQPAQVADVSLEGLATPVEILTLHSPVKQGTPVHHLGGGDLSQESRPLTYLQGISTTSGSRAPLASQAPYSKAAPSLGANNGVSYVAASAATSLPVEPLQAQHPIQLEQSQMPAHFTPRTKEPGPRVFPAPRQLGQYQESQSLMAPAVRTIDLHDGGAVVDTLGVTTARPTPNGARQAASLHAPSRTAASAAALPANLRPAAPSNGFGGPCSMGPPVSATASLPVPRPQQQQQQSQQQQQQRLQQQYVAWQQAPSQSVQAYSYPNSYQSLPPSMVAAAPPSAASWYAGGQY